MMLTKAEKQYYPRLKTLIEEALKSRFAEFHVEITASKNFTNKLKAQIPEHRNLIFHFLREAPPDLTGFVKGEYNATDFLVAEFKKGRLRLDDVYQARKYAELFDAKYALLITTEEIPEELKRLSKVVYSLLHLSHWSRKFVIARFDEERDAFVEWFEEHPFLEKA